MVNKNDEMKQLDILAAAKGKDEFIELEEEIKEQKSKITIFDFVNDIRKTKKMDMLDKEENLPIWNSYMILQALSMKEGDVFLCNLLNKYSGILSKQQMYQALTYLIPRDHNFHRWIKKTNVVPNENSESVSRYFECSLSEAEEYIKVMGLDWSEQIKNQFGGEVSRHISKPRKGKL